MIPQSEQLQNPQESASFMIKLCQLQFIPEHLQPFLAKIYLFANKHHSVKALIALGSLVQKSLTNNSDLDLCLLIEDGKYEEILRDLKKFFNDTLFYTLSLSPKVVLFFKTAVKNTQKKLVKIDLFIINNTNDILKYFEELSLTVTDPLNIVLLDKDNDKRTILEVNKILKTFRESSPLVKEKILYNIHSCINAFENASHAQTLNDSYRFYFNINIAYHYVLVLQYMLTGKMDNLYLPRNIYALLFKNSSRSGIEELEPRSDLQTADVYKEKLKKVLLITIEQLQIKYAIDFDLSTIQELLENILEKQ